MSPKQYACTPTLSQYFPIISFCSKALHAIGGLIGDKIYSENYKGDFQKTSVFLGTSNPDPHVPVETVYMTANILKKMNATVTEKVYNNMGHTIAADEIEMANTLIFKASQAIM